MCAVYRWHRVSLLICAYGRSQSTVLVARTQSNVPRIPVEPVPCVSVAELKITLKNHLFFTFSYIHSYIVLILFVSNILLHPQYKFNQLFSYPTPVEFAGESESF